MASREHAVLTHMIGISVQSGFVGQPSPPDGLRCIASVDLKAYLQASLGRPFVLASPRQALALHESRFGGAQEAEVTCCLFLDSHACDGVTFSPKALAWRKQRCWGMGPYAAGMASA